MRGHPSDAGCADYLARIRRHSHVQWRVTTPLDELIGLASGITTVNSAVGAEAMLRGRSVLVLGEATYAPVAFRVGEGDLLAALQRLIENPRTGDLQRRWLYYMYVHYLIPVWAFEPDEVGCAAAARRLVEIDAGEMPWLTGE